MQHFVHVFLGLSPELSLFFVDLGSLELVLLRERCDFFLELVFVAHEVVEAADFFCELAGLGEERVALGREAGHELGSLLVELEVHELEVLFVRAQALLDRRVEALELLALAADRLLLLDELLGVFLLVLLVRPDRLVQLPQSASPRLTGPGCARGRILFLP